MGAHRVLLDVNQNQAPTMTSDELSAARRFSFWYVDRTLLATELRDVSDMLHDLMWLSELIREKLRSTKA